MKVLKSAVANAENNHEMNRANLIVDKAYVDQGLTLNGFDPGAGVGPV